VILGLLVIIGVGGIALLTGRREAEERPTPDPDGPPGEPPAPAFVRGATTAGAADGGVDADRPRPRAAWEVYASLENRPLGSADELLPDASPKEGIAAGAGSADAGGEGDAHDAAPEGDAELDEPEGRESRPPY
jgi:hypothetical protein